MWAMSVNMQSLAQPSSYQRAALFRLEDKSPQKHSCTLACTYGNGNTFACKVPLNYYPVQSKWPIQFFLLKVIEETAILNLSQINEMASVYTGFRPADQRTFFSRAAITGHYRRGKYLTMRVGHCTASATRVKTSFFSRMYSGTIETGY